MRRFTHYLTWFALTVGAFTVIGSPAQAKTFVPPGGPGLAPADPVPNLNGGISVVQAIAIAVCASLVTVVAVLMVQWVRIHHQHRGLTRAA